MVSAKTVVVRAVAAGGLLLVTACPGGPHVPPTWSADAAPPPPAKGSRPRPGHGGLSGFVDLHTHPLSNLGFAGKLVYGGVDADPAGGALLPADPSCHKDVRALTVDQALGPDNSTHGGWGIDADPLDLFDGKFGMTNPCGDSIRQLVITAVQNVNDANNPGPNASGYNAFPDWPEWNDITHQSMWIDWIKRTYVAGLSVMVALTVNNQTLGDSVAGPGDGPSDDMSSADLQLREIKALAARHADWMEVAYSAADVKRIVEEDNKLAIVLGMEVDNIGNFNKKPNFTQNDVHAEIGRLYDEGVRYVFPVHLIDNPFGSTAAYDDIFNLSNLREAGHFWNLKCAPPSEHINYVYQLGNPLKQTFDLNPPSTLTAEMAALMVAKLGMLSDTADDPTVPPGCPGMWNVGETVPGLTPMGEFAIREMMKRGMLIDIDHMSQASITNTLDLAWAEQYPVNSGHNSVRDASGGSERSLTAPEYAKIASLHGMAGVGGARTNDAEWLALYDRISNAMGGKGPAGAIGFGTDADGVSPLMRPPPVGSKRVTYTTDFPKSTLGTSSWDYNTTGVAHYGMLADFVVALQGLESEPDAGALDAGALDAGGLGGGRAAVEGMMAGAQYFFDTWRLAERYAAKFQDAGAPAPASAATPSCAQGTVYMAACGTCLPPRGACPGVAPVVCGPTRKADAWGVCSSANAKPIAAPVPAVARAAAGRAIAGPALTPGAYTLVLVGSSDAEAKKARKVAGFAVDVAADGRRVVFREHGAKAGAPSDFGGFRANRFIGRMTSGTQVLVLTATTAATGPVSDLRGSYIAHAPGQPSVTGYFVLKATPELKKVPAGIKKYGELGSGFLEVLRK